MSKHTPGPWYIEKLHPNDWQINSDSVDHCLFQITPVIGNKTLTVRDKANARLIAAAPDLLESIQELIAAQNAEGRPAGGFSLKPATREHQRRVFLAWQRIHAAIAKATGASNG